MLDNSPAVIVNVVPFSVKSFATAGATGAADTVTVTWSSAAPVRVAVTVLTPPFSEMEVGDSFSVTDNSSSSSMYSVRALASVTPGRPVTKSFTHTGLSGSSTRLSTAVTVTVPVLHFEPAAIASVRFSLSVKSSVDERSPVSTRTVTPSRRSLSGSRAMPTPC